MELIRPLLKLLGWNDFLPQQGSDHNEEIPDYLLFGDTETKDTAPLPNPPPQRYPGRLGRRREQALWPSPRRTH